LTPNTIATNIPYTNHHTVPAMSKPPKTYEQYYAELQRQAEKDRKTRAARLTVNVDSEDVGFGQLCVSILFIVGGLLAGAYIMGLI
jgi:hypothetical protein